MADEEALGGGERCWRQRRDGVGGAQSEQAMGVRASYPERECVCEPRKAEFEAECHARVTQWACVYVRAARYSELVSDSVGALVLRQSRESAKSALPMPAQLRSASCTWESGTGLKGYQNR